MLSPDSNAGWVSPQEFQALLMERKAERKELVQRKREEDLRSIAIMNADIHVTHLFLLHPEIWLMVFAYLDNPKDLWNIYHAHSIFQGVLETTKIQDMLFPLAVRDVDQFLFPDKSALRNDHKVTTTLTEIRKFSKSLEKAVDHVVKENLLQPNGLEYYFQRESETRLPFGLREHVDGLQKLDQMIMKASLPHTNLFLKTLHVNVICKPPFIEPLEWKFGKKITSFLEVVGFQIENFKFEIAWAGFETWDNEEQLGLFRQYYISLRQWSVLMRNLKRLIIHTWNFKNCLGENKNKKVAVNVNSNLKSFLNRYPFPTLEFLEMFAFEIRTTYRPNIPTVELVEAILSSNVDVKEVAFHPNCWGSFQSLSPILLDSLNLSAFTSFPLFECPYNNHSYIIMERVIVTTTGYHLNRLDMGMRMSNSSLNNLLGFLQYFPQLQNVRLNLEKLGIGNERIEKISLPNLRNFVCTLDSPDIFFVGQAEYLASFFNFQFLITSKMLRNIDLSIISYEPVTLPLLKFHLETRVYHDTIDFWDPRRNFEKSNIWNVFPQLEHVKLIGKTLIGRGWKIVISSECRRSQKMISTEKEFGSFKM